ncbi:MAG: GNAT family N-acetyltransferase [Acidimicrobiales bacterium]
MNDHQSPRSPLSPRRQSQLRQRFPNLRVATWQGADGVALVGPARNGRMPDADTLVACVNTLAEQGITKAVTPALAAYDCVPFVRAGFELYERLHLLSRRLDLPPPAPTMRTKSGRRWHLDTVLDIDQRAFEAFWRFDVVALNEARHATPTSRYRVLALEGTIVGYHVTGKAGTRGYLQRLAVDPSYAGQGIGTELVFDSLSWLHQHRVAEALVNTQERNTRALALYERHGFVRQQEGLTVLSWTADQ